jgi:glutaconate CoA-transferase subunit B
MSTDYSLAELAIVAASEIFRDETPEVFATLIGTLPKLAGYVARETFLPGMMMSDGIYYLAAEPVPVGPRGDYPIKKEGRIGSASLPLSPKVTAMLLLALFRLINMDR